MRKKWEIPEMEVILSEEDDVITTSGDGLNYGGSEGTGEFNTYDSLFGNQ